MTLPFTVAEMFAVDVVAVSLNASQTCSAISVMWIGVVASLLPVAALATFAEAFLAGAAFLVAAFFATDFLTEAAFLAGTFLEGAFLATAFLGVAFLAVVFLGVGLLFAMLDRLVHMIP